MFNSGLVSADVVFSLHTAAPPSDANKQTGAWYSDVPNVAGRYTITTVAGYRRLVTSHPLLFGRLPDPAPTAPTHIAMKQGSTLLGYGTIAFTGYAASRLLEIPAGMVMLEYQLVGTDIP